MDKLLTAEEVQEHLRISDVTLRRWRRLGKVKALVTPGGYLRFRESDVERILQEEVAAV